MSVGHPCELALYGLCTFLRPMLCVHSVDRGHLCRRSHHSDYVRTEVRWRLVAFSSRADHISEYSPDQLELHHGVSPRLALR